MAQALNKMADIFSRGKCDRMTLPWWQLRYEHTRAMRALLQELYASSTANKMLSALRGVLLECRRLGLMKADDYLVAIDIKQISAQKLPVGRFLSPDEIAALMNVCCRDVRAAGFRDGAMLAILRAGCRRSEVVGVDVADYDQQTGALNVRGGKGNKERTTYVPAGGMQAIGDWLLVRGDSPGALLLGINKGNAIQMDVRLSDQAVLRMLARRGPQAGVTNLSPHDFRRTFVSELLDLGADMVTVSRLVGHSSPETTARYDLRSEEAKQRAVSMLHLPYHRVAPIV